LIERRGEWCACGHARAFCVCGHLTHRSPRMRRALERMAGLWLRASSRTKRFTFSLARFLSRRHTLPSDRKAWARTWGGGDRGEGREGKGGLTHLKACAHVVWALYV
jgi:hypothetical protein